ncbi:unnamed protein product [Musa hybrid cultivar]
MGSELIYRGHDGLPLAESDGYTSKPEKRLLWLLRPLRYLLREQRLLFMLLIIFICTRLVFNRSIYSESRLPQLLVVGVLRPLFSQIVSEGKVPSMWLFKCLNSFVHKTDVVGTLNMHGLAKRVGARFLLTSTSEVYGDPLQHPQAETYWGNVNPIGARSCYDEGKRTAETLTMDYHRGAQVEVTNLSLINTIHTYHYDR